MVAKHVNKKKCWQTTSPRTADVSPRSSSRNVPQRRWARRNVCRSQASKPRFLAINTLLHSLADLASTFSAVALQMGSLILLLPLVMPSHRQNEFCANLMYPESDPGWAGYPTLKRLHGKIWSRLRGLPGLADRATRLGGSPHLSCKRDQIKWEIIWTAELPHLSGLPHLPGVPHLHVNRPLDASFRKIVISFMLSVLRLGSFVSRTKYWNASCFSLVTQRSKGGEIVTKRSLVAKMKNNWYFLW